MPSNPATGQRQRSMPSFMPLVHQARRTIRNRQEGNPFATDDSVRREIDQLSAAYLATRNDRVARLLKAELDLLETLI
jgi:predicted component of type VI protein secretion system